MTPDTEDAFWAWCNRANPGDVLEYYRGSRVLLNAGRNDEGSIIWRKCPPAKAAWDAYVLGLVNLVRRRMGKEDFVWIAQRRPHGSKPPLTYEGQKNTTEPFDWSTSQGAQALANRIESYWRKAGFSTIKAWAEPVKNSKSASYFGVRTNLVGGWPPNSDQTAWTNVRHIGGMP